MMIQRYAVVGDFEFPLDMLRYDGSYPATEADAATIYKSIRDGRVPDKPVQLSRIVVNRQEQPEVERWASFGYKVFDVKIVR